MQRISTRINDATYYAFVGLYPEEYKIPNKIIVNIAITQECDIHNLPMTDYSQINEIVKDTLRAKHYPLLEDIITSIHDAIASRWTCTSIQISIEKAHPPTGDSIRSSQVAYAT